jgi:hypothetical protein
MTIFPGRQVPNRSQLEAYVEAELGKAVPSDWRVVREDPKRLWWLLQRVSILQGEWPIQDFSLLVSDDLQWLFFTHGNKDCGPWGLHHALMDAMVISVSSLRLPALTGDDPPGLLRFQLSECIRFLFEHRKPNEWGYT